jgi:hypothetical protein
MVTDAECKNASCPPDKTRVRLACSGGLYLEVAPNEPHAAHVLVSMKILHTKRVWEPGDEGAISTAEIGLVTTIWV